MRRKGNPRKVLHYQSRMRQGNLRIPLAAELKPPHWLGEQNYWWCHQLQNSSTCMATMAWMMTEEAGISQNKLCSGMGKSCDQRPGNHGTSKMVQTPLSRLLGRSCEEISTIMAWRSHHNVERWCSCHYQLQNISTFEAWVSSYKRSPG